MVVNGRLVDAAWECRRDSLASKLVLVFLAVHADECARCRVEPREVARATGMSEKRVDEVLAGLNADGLIDAHKWNDTGAWSLRVTL